MLAVERWERAWRFKFDGAQLVVECIWRVLADGRIRITSEDDGQRFGLPEPLEAAARAMERLGGKPISSVEVHAGTLDLAIECDNHTLEVLPTSAGYDAWQLSYDAWQLNRVADGLSFIACGGGELATWVRPCPPQ